MSIAAADALMGIFGFKRVKPKTCRVCKQKFTPTRQMQPVCEEFSCKVAYATKVAEKSAQRRNAAERKADAKRREDMKTIPDLIKEVSVLCHEYVRLRDAFLPCISCGRADLSDPLTGGAWDAGHYRSRGSAPHLRFDLRNIHRQCKHCNNALGGNHGEMRRGMVARFGEAFVLELESDQTPRKYSRDDLRSLRSWFRQAIRELKDERSRMAA